MKITKNQYISALSTSGILKEGNQELLSILFFAPQCEATAPEITAALGLGNESGPANSKLGNLGKRISNFLNLNPPERKEKSPGWWQIIATGEKRKNGFYWQLKEELAEALIDLNLLDSFDPKLFPEEIHSSTYHEGTGKKVIVNKYERNPVARRICIKHYGTICAVCNFSFTKRYGIIGKDFIHVHHLTEISSIGKDYKVNPIKDLCPVCPNCHAMLHQKTPAYSIEELQEMLKINT